MIIDLSEVGKKALESLLNELNLDFSWVTTTGYGISSELKWSDKSLRVSVFNQEIIVMNLNGMGLTSLPKTITQKNFPGLKGLNFRNNELI